MEVSGNLREILTFSKAHHLESVEDLLYFPKYVQIETVALCNARCFMCPVDEWRREVKAMQQDVFDKVIAELSLYSSWVEKVTIQLDGEPLLDKKLEARIKTLKKIGIRCVAFSSNASLMDQARAESIILSGVDEVTFSIDGATAQTFEGRH